MNNKNNIGPYIDPWGTPALAVVNSERPLPFGTACLRLLR